ncbi:di-heme-cytochrome C peroxidase [Azospirillum sp. sgz302134]
MNARLLTALAAGTMLLSACAEQPPALPQDTTIKPPQQIGDLWYLDQGWNDQDRQWYYNTTQGSQIIRYDWFMALEDPETKDLFHKGITRFGYLRGTPSTGNPDLLPVGFVKDTDSDSTAWVGMTCAACHTGDVRVGDKTMRIDGAVTTGDLYGFISALSRAVHATVAVDGKFEPFAKRVLGPDATAQQKRDLLAKLQEFDASFAHFVEKSTPATPWGPMRTDAFAMIFNRVSAIDLNIDKNNAAPDAPVSYPYLWDAPHQSVVQWNGLMDNNGALAALGRNSGEVLGVFGKATLKKPKHALDFYPSTVRARNLINMENQLRALRSPVWPEQIAGPIDRVKVAAGKELYDQNCSSCHAVLKRTEPNTTVPTTMVPLFKWANEDDATQVANTFRLMCTGDQGVQQAVDRGLVTVNYGADPKTAVDALCRFVNPGVLTGTVMPPAEISTLLKKLLKPIAPDIAKKVPTGTPLANPDLAALLLSNAVFGTILQNVSDEPELLALLFGEDIVNGLLGQSKGKTKSGTSATNVTKALAVAKLLEKAPDTPTIIAAPTPAEKAVAVRNASATANPQPSAQDVSISTLARKLLAYKSRPLDGVWATAPYMHNSSVPNLYELLLPVSQRSATFRVGTTSFDPVKVGVDQAASDNSFTFDTSKPGNRATGHEYGATLTDEQRFQLIEYLKTL